MSHYEPQFPDPSLEITTEEWEELQIGNCTLKNRCLLPNTRVLPTKNLTLFFGEHKIVGKVIKVISARGGRADVIVKLV